MNVVLRKHVCAGLSEPLSHVISNKKISWNDVYRPFLTET